MWELFRNLNMGRAPKTDVFWHFSLFGVAEYAPKAKPKKSQAIKCLTFGRKVSTFFLKILFYTKNFVVPVTIQFK